MLTANAQSLPPKIDELIALIQVENFDVVGPNETWLDTQKKHLLAEISIHGYKVFSTNQPQLEGGRDQTCTFIENTLNRIETKSIDTCTGK